MSAQQNKWDAKELKSTDKAWSERTFNEKVLYVTIQFLKVIVAVGLLYIFLISLSLMGGAFKIIGGPTAGEVFRNSEIFSNPFAGCSLGVLATVLVQSSSTSTSIIISMTAAGLMEPENAIYMIMGANIGTSVTNTIVSVSHVGVKDEYRRAFAGATVHDCFNLLTVVLLLPLEYFTHMLYHIGSGIVDAAGIEEDQDKSKKIDFIKKITKPVTARLVQVDKKLVTKVAMAESFEEREELMKKSMIKNKRTTDNHFFMDTPLSDSGAGWLCLIVSLALLSTTLILLVKLLQTIFRGRAAIYMQKLLNLEFKAVPFVADYILVLFGVGITILMQSSSVTTSTLTPLVGIGLIKLEKMFPFTVGANIGTTITGMLSALAGSNIATGMSVALAHLFFNLIGTIIWFPLPFVRAVPLAMAKGLGSLAADLRWFPIVYIIFTFGILPGFLFVLSLAHWAALVFVGLPFLLVLGAILCVFALRAYKPGSLPEMLQRDYNWMPESMKIKIEVQDQATGSQEGKVGSADIESANKWWLAPTVYGLSWYVLILLLLAVPNAKLGDMKYAKFDNREHIGLGSWSACSNMFKSEVAWAPKPYLSTSADWARHLEQCTSDLNTKCKADSSFSTQLGANEVYEESWRSCSNATTEDWTAKCKTFIHCGSGHEKQCLNVSTAVSRPYTKDYSQRGTKWTKATEANHNYCIPVESLCDDVGSITTAGNLGVAAIVFGLLGLFLLLAYVVLNSNRDVRKLLWASCGAYSLTWVLLLASWASFASTMGLETTCYVQDDQNDGIIRANGKFGEIMNEGGSYGYVLMIASWILLMPVIGMIVQRIIQDNKNEKDDATNGAVDSVEI